MSYLPFCLTYLTQYDNLRSIHVATNGIFTLFYGIDIDKECDIKNFIYLCTAKFNA